MTFLPSLRFLTLDNITTEKTGILLRGGVSSVRYNTINSSLLQNSSPSSYLLWSKQHDSPNEHPGKTEKILGEDGGEVPAAL